MAWGQRGRQVEWGAVEGSGVLGTHQASDLGSPSHGSGSGRQSSEGGPAGRGGGLANYSPAFILQPKPRSLKSSAPHKLAVVGLALGAGWGHPSGPPSPSPPHPHPHCCSFATCHFLHPLTSGGGWGVISDESRRDWDRDTHRRTCLLQRV